MFPSRKYTPLPTNANPQRRRAGGGISAWKRWLLVGAGVSVVLVLGYSAVPSRDVTYEPTWSGETYTPNLEKVSGEVDETDYSSPPFRPTEDDEDEEEQEMHIQPIDEDHMHEGVVQHPDDGVGSPHDPTASEAVGAHDAEPDFTEFDDDTAEPTGLPTSFEEDEDPASTMVCVEPYDDHKPLVQYALTIDAGSTGSRIHVYKFHNCGPSPELEYETFKMLNPGLSAFAKDPTAAAASLDPLLDEAMRVVPPSLHSCTPVEVKATAGLRLLGTLESNAILDEVRNRLETKYKFVVGGERAVEIMDGKDEGVYAWITANYLAQKIGEGTKSPDTLAVMDLGGASTQIVFEPRFPAETDALAEGEHKYALTFGGREFVLYQHSYLGYGLMRARRSVHNLVAFTWSFGQAVEWDALGEDDRVPNPCLSYGSTRRVELDPPGRNKVNVTMHGGNGGFDACDRVVQLVMAKDA
jgi:guanosine-diphosphatase